MLSIKELRAAGAPDALIARRLDFDDGLRVPFTVLSEEAANEALRTLRAALPPGASDEELLPAECSLELQPGPSPSPLQIVVAGQIVGHMPAGYAVEARFGGRLVDIGCWQRSRWKVLCVPSEG